MAEPVLEAVDVEVHFGRVRALEGATLSLAPGRIVALVGESGSGKTTLARTLALVQKPTGGEVRLAGEAVKPGRKAARRAYAKRVQMVLQDPFSSLNPLHRVRYLLERPLQLHSTGTGDLDADVRGLLERVRLTPVDRFIDAFPHELSGGQRQRVAIARALAVRPDVLLGDEPVSMLDVSIRLEVLNLLARLRDEEGTAMLYITHDIAGARYVADEIVVMYAGEMVEQGTAEQITQSPAHPYTELLLASSPDPDNAGFLEGDTPAGEPPDLMDPPSGCRFHPRCPLAMPICSEASPPRLPAGDGHWTRCWLSHPDHATAAPAAQAAGQA